MRFWELIGYVLTSLVFWHIVLSYTRGYNGDQPKVSIYYDLGAAMAERDREAAE